MEAFFLSLLMDETEVIIFKEEKKNDVVMMACVPQSRINIYH